MRLIRSWPRDWPRRVPHSREAVAQRYPGGSISGRREEVRVGMRTSARSRHVEAMPDGPPGRRHRGMGWRAGDFLCTARPLRGDGPRGRRRPPSSSARVDADRSWSRPRSGRGRGLPSSARAPADGSSMPRDRPWSGGAPDAPSGHPGATRTAEADTRPRPTASGTPA